MRKKTSEEIAERNLEFRIGNYPTMSNQIAAIINYLSTKNDLTKELQDIVDKIDKVKIKYPKE